MEVRILSQIAGNKAKGRISKRVFQESKARQNFRKTNISYLLIRTSGGKKCLFFGNLGVFYFLETPVLRFAFLPYYRRNAKKYHFRELYSIVSLCKICISHVVCHNVTIKI